MHILYMHMHMQIVCLSVVEMGACRIFSETILTDDKICSYDLSYKAQI